MPYWLYRNSSLIWENYTGDSNAASCSPVQTNASQLRDNCVTFQSLVTACIVGGRPAGELWLCVCVYMRLNGMAIEGLRNVGVSGHRIMCVRLCVCETMKAIPLGSKSLHSWRTWVIWFSAVQKNSKLFYLKLCLTIAWNNRRYIFMKQGKSWGRFIYLTHAEKSWIEAEPSHFGSESKDNMKKAVWQLTWLNH